MSTALETRAGRAALDAIEAWQAQSAAGRTVTQRDDLVAEVSEGGAVSRYTYDARGDLVRIDEPDGTRREYTYGPDGRLLSVTLDGRPHAAFAYDAAGRLESVRGPAGPRTHAYDEAGRPVRTLRGDAGSFAYRYDGAGRVALARCDHEETRFGYDATGRVISITQSVDGIELAAAFEFAADGRLARTRFPAWAMALEYAWDERGRPLSLAWTRGDGAPDVLARFGYAEAKGARLAWRETADAVREETAHHPADGRLLRQRLLRGGEVMHEMAAEHGPGWRIEREGERIYRYDEAGRLAGAEESELRWSFRWTAMDDLASEDGPTPLPELVETDAAGRVTRVVRAGADVVYRYDQAHQLTEVRENGDRVVRFRYDHKGRLLSKETAAGTERYLYGADDRLLAVANADGSPRLVYLRLPSGDVGAIDFSGSRDAALRASVPPRLLPSNAPVPATRPATGAGDGQPVFFHHDGRGNLCFASGEGWIEAHRADPFGLPLDPPGRATHRHHHRPWHAEAGLYRVGCRWYAPALRRFLTPDSYTGAPDDERLVNPFVTARQQRGRRAQILGDWLKQPRVRNPHAYCGNDPVNRTDPNGHWSFGGVLLSLLGAIWTLPNTLFGLVIEISCLVGEVVRWIVWLFSGGHASWDTPGFDAAASGRLNAFALVFSGGWFMSIDPNLLGITFGNVVFTNKNWRTHPAFVALPDPVSPPAYTDGTTVPKDQALYEHELRHTNQYGWFGPFFHLGLPLFGVYEWDVIFNGYNGAWTERDARDHAGF